MSKILIVEDDKAISGVLHSILSDENYEILQKCSSFLDILDERLDFYEGGLTEAIYLREVNTFLKKSMAMSSIQTHTSPSSPIGTTAHSGLHQAASPK